MQNLFREETSSRGSFCFSTLRSEADFLLESNREISPGCEAADLPGVCKAAVAACGGFSMVYCLFKHFLLLVYFTKMYQTLPWRVKNQDKQLWNENLFASLNTDVNSAVNSRVYIWIMNLSQRAVQLQLLSLNKGQRWIWANVIWQHFCPTCQTFDL